MVSIWIWLVVEPYPSEKDWSSSILMSIPNIWKNKSHVPNRQPAKKWWSATWFTSELEKNVEWTHVCLQDGNLNLSSTWQTPEVYQRLLPSPSRFPHWALDERCDSASGLWKTQGIFVQNRMGFFGILWGFSGKYLGYSGIGWENQERWQSMDWLMGIHGILWQNQD